MIKLHFPKSTETMYLYYDFHLFGPTGQMTDYVGDSCEIEIPTDYIEGTRRAGLYGENDVEHIKTTGDVYYRRSMSDVVLATPSATYPDSISVPWGPGSYYMSAYCGFATPGRVTLVSGSVQTQYSFEQFLSEGFVYYKVNSYVSEHTKIRQFERIALKPLWVRNAGGYLLCQRTRELFMYSTPLATAYDWSVRRLSLSDFQNQYADCVARKSLAIYSMTSIQVAANDYNYIRYPSDIIDIQKIRSDLLWTVGTLGQYSTLDTELTYGDLAMKATEKINLTKTSVLLLLRDLRHPAEMIPKLKNLASVKSWANDYLTVKYGILPTVSDLQKVIGAFGKHRHRESNGFTTYNAEHTSSQHYANGLGCDVTVEQHVKVAVADEDDGFEAVLDQLESIGSMPNLETVWDIVPYSFVIDWFVDVGGFLERVDTRLRLLRFNVRYATMSRKHTVDYHCHLGDDPNLDCTIHRVQYHRWVSDQCPVPPLSLQTPLTALDHWLEGAALLVQRAFKH